MVNHERMLNHLLELIRIDSESFDEKQVAEKLRREMEELGGQAEIDDAAEKAGSNTGNLFVRFPASAGNGMPLFLSAHMDTVVPGRNVKPIVSDGRVTTDGSTILGGDDKSGCAILVELMRTIQEQNLPHGTIEICFTIAEEKGLLGAKYFDTGRLESKYGLVLDSDDPNLICVRAPAADRMEWIIHGREAHAGVEPEKGISAIKVAARAVAAMTFGRIDPETTSNIGVVEGGAATNIIANRVRLLGEARSLDIQKLEEQTRHLSECLHRAVDDEPPLSVDGKTWRARLEERIERDYEAMAVSDDSPIVQLVQRAAERIGAHVLTGAMGGGCDANAFNQRGLECGNLGTGMRDIHTVNEWLDIDDFNRCADLMVEVIREAGEGG